MIFITAAKWGVTRLNPYFSMKVSWGTPIVWTFVISSFWILLGQCVIWIDPQGDNKVTSWTECKIWSHNWNCKILKSVCTSHSSHLILSIVPKWLNEQCWSALLGSYMSVTPRKICTVIALWLRHLSTAMFPMNLELLEIWWTPLWLPQPVLKTSNLVIKITLQLKYNTA